MSSRLLYLRLPFWFINRWRYVWWTGLTASLFQIRRLYWDCSTFFAPLWLWTVFHQPWFPLCQTRSLALCLCLPATWWSQLSWSNRSLSVPASSTFADGYSLSVPRGSPALSLSHSSKSRYPHLTCHAKPIESDSEWINVTWSTELKYAFSETGKDRSRSVVS